jgi:tetratricopeptide (TPR) repeat protein
MAVAARNGHRTMTSPARSSRALVAAVAAALVVATIAIYAPVRHADFLSIDDTTYVTENPYVRAGLTGPGIRHAFLASRGALWMPLAFVSHMIDVELFGLDPTGPHLVNIGLHAVNAILLLLLLVRATGAVAPSIVVTAVFALHPLRVESVAWIAERKDVLSACFGLLALHAWVSYARRPAFARYLVVVAATALALLSKPMLVSLPLLMLLLDLWPLRRLAAEGRAHATVRDLVLDKIPLLLMAAATAGVTLLSARADASMPTLAERPLAARVAHATVAYVWYAWKTVWPADLAVLYPYPSWSAWQIAGAALVLGLVGVVALAAHRRAPWTTFGLAWFAIGLFPVIGFFQAGSQGMADRFTYVPGIGLAIAVVWTLDALVRAPRARAALGAAATVYAATLAIASAHQVTYWRDPLALYGHTLAVTSSNWMIETEMGNTWLRRGDLERAYARFEDAYRIEPRYAVSAFGLGLAATALGRADEAELRYRDAVRIDPGYAKAHNNLGILLYQRGDVDEALHHLSEAARSDPDSPELVTNLKRALADSGISDVDRYLEHLSTWSAEVAADRSRPGGAAYGSTLMGMLVGPRVEAVRACFAGGGGPPAPFAIYVEVGADGALAEVAASPPTRVARCFRDELRDARAPAPPFAPFHALMAMRFDG